MCSKIPRHAIKSIFSCAFAVSRHLAAVKFRSHSSVQQLNIQHVVRRHKRSVCFLTQIKTQPLAELHHTPLELLVIDVESHTKVNRMTEQNTTITVKWKYQKRHVLGNCIIEMVFGGDFVIDWSLLLSYCCVYLYTCIYVCIRLT